MITEPTTDVETEPETTDIQPVDPNTAELSTKDSYEF